MPSALPPGVGGDVYLFVGPGDERDDPESEILRFPPLPLPLPFPKPDVLELFGVDGACRLVEPEEDVGGGVPDLPAFARRAAFWLFLPKGDSAAAEGRFEAGDGMLDGS